jgi:hypothetical protein
MANKSLHTNRRPVSPFRKPLVIESWIRRQRPVPAAVGDLTRSLKMIAVSRAFA